MSTAMDTAERNAAAQQLAAFGESVVYIPFAGAERNIIAIVEREGIARVPGTKQGTGPIEAVSVANSETLGITPAEFTANKDKIRLAVNLGETPQDRVLTKILDQDGGMIVIGVR